MTPLRTPRALLLLLLCACSPGGDPSSPQGEPAGRALPKFVGRETCVSCHEREGKLYEGSDHDRAMDEAREETVLGNFDGATLEHFGVVTTFSREGERFLVETDGPDGELTTYEIAYVFGYDPLQQYLVRFPGGALQCLPIAWDTRPADQGGQRWFHLYPDDPLPAGDPLHWTGRYLRWNSMCARCHSTGLERGYDPETHHYRTRWEEIDVSCEACHGPGADHVAWARGDQQGENGLLVSLRDSSGGQWSIDPETGNAKRSAPRSSHAQSETCARCHSRRSTIAEAPVDGSSFHDQYRLSFLQRGLYHPDGQILDEVYVYGSFLQSPMYAHGVTCSDCHDPHTTRTLYPGNALCARCHQPAKYDRVEHTHHAAPGKGSQCVDCHMPERTYMIVDPRRDHSLRVPRPDLSVKLGTPNACNGCHQDQDAAWAAERVREWFPEGRSGKPDRAEAIAAAWSGDPEAETKLSAVAADTEEPGIVRATAIDLLRGARTPEGARAIVAGLEDPDPLVRLAAVGIFDSQPEEAKARQLVFPLLSDPVRAVRAEAARVLAPIKELPPSRQEAFDAAMQDFIASQLANADRPESQLNLGVFRMQRGRLIDAERSFREALELDPGFLPAIANLADVLRARKRDDLAEEVLEKGLQRFPDNPSLLQALGLLYARTKRSEEAVGLLGRAAAGDPSNPRLAYVYGVALGSTERVDEALAVLDEAHRRFPGDIDIVQALATYSRDAGDTERAVEYARELVRLLPGDASAARLLEDLEKALGNESGGGH